MTTPEVVKRTCDALRELLERVDASSEDRAELEFAASVLTPGSTRRAVRAIRRAAVLADDAEWAEAFRGAAEDLEKDQAVYAAEHDIRAEVSRAVN